MGQKVLIVEDDVPLREYTSELLVAEGYEVAQLGNADNIVFDARSSLADLVLLDYHLPGVDGLTALKSMREKFMTLPVVIMTADTSPQVILQCFRDGADDFIGKPYDEVYLSVIVRRALERASLNLKDAVFRLLRYARHADDCNQSGKEDCSCGLQQAITEATKATEGPRGS